MKKKFIFILVFTALLIILSCIYGIKIFKDKQVNTQLEEYIPQEEIADLQLRKTMVKLFFYNNETGKLEKEARLVDAIDLLDNPYRKLVQMLIEGPKHEKLNSLIPSDAKVLNTSISNGCVTLDMSVEFLNHTEDLDLKNKMIYSIVNTLTELTEVERVKFQINGKPNDIFNEEYVRIQSI